MLKILYIVPNNVLNGTERYVLDMAIGLKKEGYNIWVATPMKGSYSRLLEENSINEFCFENGKLLKVTFKGTKNLFRFIRKQNFDIVHSNCGLHGVLFGRICGVKLCIESRQGLFFTKEQIDKPGLWTKFKEFIKSKFVHYYITGNENDAETLVKAFKVNRKKIRIIYNGINFEPLRYFRELKDNRKVNSNEIIIGNLGRLTYQKGQDILIRIMEKVCINHKNIKLVIIGDGEEKSNLESLIKNMNLANNIELKPYTDNFRTELVNMDILVLTSRFEGIPYVILESMYIGTPVISTPVGGISEVIINNKNGFLISTEDTCSCAGVLVKVLSDAVNLKNVTKEAKLTMEKFNIINMIDITKNFYIKAISK